MTKAEYDEIIGFLKGRLKKHPETGLSGNRAEGYEKGILAAMPKVREIYKRGEKG